jgi:hypothetical protein
VPVGRVSRHVGKAPWKKPLGKSPSEKRGPLAWPRENNPPPSRASTLAVLRQSGGLLSPPSLPLAPTRYTSARARASRVSPRSMGTTDLWGQGRSSTSDYSSSYPGAHTFPRSFRLLTSRDQPLLAMRLSVRWFVFGLPFFFSFFPPLYLAGARARP